MDTAAGTWLRQGLDIGRGASLDRHVVVLLQRLREHLAARLARAELTSDLGLDPGVPLHTDQVEQRRLLVGRQVALVALRKDQQAMVPQHRHPPLANHAGPRPCDLDAARLIRELQEVVHEGVDRLVRQRILLVEQDPDCLLYTSPSPRD